MQPRGRSKYLYCEVCAEGNYRARQKCPEWFPLKKVHVNHLDGSTKRIWVWSPDYRGRSQDHWVRKLTPAQKEFYMARREAMANVKAASETQFVCRPCQICAENGLRGEKNHRDAGCPGDASCDCQHREDGRVAK
jgi:hypothetical protein